MKRKIRLQLLTSVAILGALSTGRSADIICVQQTPLPLCLSFYGPVSDWTFYASTYHDAAGTCTRYSKQKWLCDNDPGDPATYGYKTKTDLLLGYCDKGTDCK